MHFKLSVKLNDNSLKLFTNRIENDIIINKKGGGNLENKEKSTTLVNFMMDKNDKIQMEQICKEMGLSMTNAFNIFAKKVIKERRIPFELSAPAPAEQTYEYKK